MHDRYRSLSWPAYSVAAALAVMPICDAVLLAWPPQLGVERWRFGVVGLVSNALLISTAGQLVALAMATVRQHRHVLRALALASAVEAGVIALVTILFVVDATRTRAAVSEALTLSYEVAAVSAVVKLLLAIVSLTAFAIAGLHAARPEHRHKAQREGRNMLPLITEQA